MLNHSLSSVKVKRVFLSNMFGGNPQAVFSEPVAKHVERHGYDHFMFPNLQYHPDAPRRQGAPGLFYSVSGGYDWFRDNLRVLVNIELTWWVYMGQYDMIEVKPLSVEEWLVKTSSPVRQKWCSEMKQQGWGKLVRIRTYLRKKHKREPTIEEIKAALQEKNLPTSSVSVEDIQASFDSGQEMKCVRFDHEFVELLHRLTTDKIYQAEFMSAKSMNTSAKGGTTSKRKKEL